MDIEIDALRQTVLNEREWGHTTFLVTERTLVEDDGNSVASVLDDFVDTLGFTGLGDGWIEIDRRSAQEIVQYVLYRDLAYKLAGMSAKRALQLTEQFLALFCDDARYFTNGVFYADGLRTWTPITDATFDAGAICIDTTRIGILWVQDED